MMDQRTGPFLKKFRRRRGLSLRVLTEMGMADERWAWPITFGVLYKMNLELW